ncbi:hypothetical protein DPEC_G00081990 [Dallia pectoralis]|uniref:Uncharacterized protein n=1 Tax=Dallia pectoralis TaxID=75939 RepID=A0ACC2GYZ8_DALPE|nr:hypothetical protein DPEC_G00081990 [Dallia pectoralis]
MESDKAVWDARGPIANHEEHRLGGCGGERVRSVPGPVDTHHQHPEYLSPFSVTGQTSFEAVCVWVPPTGG